MSMDEVRDLLYKLSAEQQFEIAKPIIERWIVQNVVANVVPDDEGSDHGLVYNLIHLLHDGRNYQSFNRWGEHYEDQMLELRALCAKHGVEDLTEGLF